MSLYFIPPAFIAIRLLARLAGGWVGGRLAAPPDAPLPGLGRGLLGQGPVGVAVAMNYSQVYPGLAAEAVLGAALLSVLVFEVVAHPEAASLLDPGGRAAEGARVAPEAEPELTPLAGTPAVARPTPPPDGGAP